MHAAAIACPSCKVALKLAQAPKGKIRCPRCTAVFTPRASAEDQTLPPSTPPRSQATQAATVPPHPTPRDTESNYVSPSPRSEDTLGQAADNGPDLSELEGLLSPAKEPGELGWLGPYRVLKILGQGGMGVVFLAEDPALERRVALKAMLPKVARNASAKDRFLREARAAAKLKHEHIVAIHQVGEDRGIPFLAIEFLEGEALDTCLGRAGTLPIAEALRIGKQIAEGLAAAHEQHLIHRDIKPANVWLEQRKGRKATVVKILDFGLAKQTNDQHHLTQSGMIIGTPAYMPPEQAGAGAVDHRADLYSLGVVLYKMVTGEVPFTGRDTMALLSALALQAPTPPVERNPSVPAELNALILKLLAKKPEDRPQSAEEVAATLEALAAPTEIASPSVAAKLAADPNRTQGFASAVTTQTATLPRQRWPMLLIGLLLLGFATMATLYFSGLIRIGTSDGDFVLDTDDPDFAFSVSKDKVLLDDKKTKRQYQLKVLAQKDGQYELEMTDADAGLTFHSKTITIRRGDKAALKAWFERKVAEAKLPPKVAPPPDPVEPPQKEPPQAMLPSPGELVDDLPPWSLPKDAPQPLIAPVAAGQAKATQAAWAKHVKREPIEENKLGMKFALIPPGDFTMIFTDPGNVAITDDMPRWRIRVSQPYYLGNTEVTVAQFRQFVEETKYVTDAEKDPKGGSNTDGGQRNPAWTWQTPITNRKAEPSEPVTQVSWNDANAFCDWLTKKEASGAASAPRGRYRLPTEAEWEFACRAGSASFHGVCDKTLELSDHAWTSENIGDPRSARPGGWKNANALGLHDMLGNAWEWCADGGFKHRGDRTYLHNVDPWGYFVYPNARGAGFEQAQKDTHPSRLLNNPNSYTHVRSNLGFRVLKQTTPLPPPGPLDRPLLVRPNGPMSRDALVRQPPPVKGLRSWSVELAGHGHAIRDIRAIGWSPKGDVIATSNAEDPVIRLWDRQGKLLRTLWGQNSNNLPQLVFSPDGRWLVTNSENIRVWNVATGACHAVIAPTVVCRPTFSPDGKLLALMRKHGSFEILDLQWGMSLASAAFVHTSDGGVIAWSPDGKTIATCHRTDDGLHFHSAPQLDRMDKVKTPRRYRLLAWSPDGKWLAAGEESVDGQIDVYDTATRTLKQTLNAKQNLQSLTWSKDSKRLLSGAQGQFFIIWDALAGKELLRSTGGGGPVAWSPDETEIAVGSQRLQIFDAATGLLKKQPLDVGRSTVESPGGGFHPISIDGKRIITRKASGVFDFWDANTGQRIDRWEKMPVGNAAFSPRGESLVVYTGESKVKNLHLIDAATGKQVRELKGHTDGVMRVAWSPDGQWLASGGKDKIVRIWDVAKATVKHELPGHDGEIGGLAWSPDGKRLASTSRIDKTIRVWDASKGQAIKEFKTVADPNWKGDPSGYEGGAVSWSADGKYLWVPFVRHCAKLEVVPGTWTLDRHPTGNSSFFPSPDHRRSLVSWVNVDRLYFLRDDDPKDRGLLPIAFRIGGQWHPDSRRFLSGFNGDGWLRGYDTATHQPLGVLVPFIVGDQWLVVSPDGHYRGSKEIDEHIVYVAQTETGEQITLPPAEFQKRYGWKNDPAKARLLGLGR